MYRKTVRICHIQLLPIMSGVQRAMLEILYRLDRERYQPVVLCKEEGHLTADLTVHGIPFRTIPELVREIHPWQDIRAWGALIRYFTENRFDIVHSHSSKTGILGRLTAYRAGVPVVVHTVQGLPFHEFSPSFIKALYSWAERLAGRVSSKIIFVNQEERLLAVNSGIIPIEKTVTIFNGVDLGHIDQVKMDEDRSSFRDKWSVTKDDFVVGYVGRLWEQKDPETLMRTIELCADLPVRFLIVGDGPYKDRFNQKFQNDRRVIMTGWMDDPMAMYPAIDALILPSLWEGLSMTLIEAMAFGKPLIASNIKGNRECVWHGENGFLCTPRDPYSFRHAIATLAGDKDLSQRMSVSGREKAAAFFDAEKNSQKVIALYEQELARLEK